MTTTDLAQPRYLIPKISLGLGLCFLYAPIILIIFYSFNGASFSHVWGGFSLRWYSALMQDAELWSATWTSLKVGLVSATAATVLGTLSALALTRFLPFKGSKMLSSLTTAPLVMPEIMMGLALLLLFITCNFLFGLPVRRGFWTICLGHTTLAMAYVTTIVRARLQEFDVTLEEAALDLGARPWVVMATITLPIIAPALLVGWLLAFMLSFDDVVIASFVSGPGATTLPMVIFSRIRTSISPEINALAAIIVAFLTVIVGGVGWYKLRTFRS